MKPKIALIGVGENNNFGHPNENVLKRIEESGSKIYRTDEEGEIVINVMKRGKVRVEKFIK